MLKMKMILFSLLVLFSSLTQAVVSSNFALGASFGYAQRQGTLELSPFEVPDGTSLLKLYRRFEDNGWYGGLVAGYEMRCMPWLVAFDISLDKQDIGNSEMFALSDSINNSALAITRYDRQWILGFSSRMGYQVLSYFIPYVRFGIETSEDRLRFKLGPNENVMVDVVGTHRIYRWFGGLGFETPISQVMKGLALRFEYNYHHKGHAVNAIDFVTSQNISFMLPASMKPVAHTTFMTVVYDFTL